jgi:hypothetical protein
MPTRSYISVAKEELKPRGIAQKASSYFHKEKHPMRKTLTIALMLAASLGLAACDKKSEDKAQDAAQHSEQAQQDMNKAQDKVNDAAKENAEAAKAQAESNEAATQEQAPATAPKTN